MRLRGKLVTDVTVDDIRLLREDGVAESRTLEYKAELPGGKDDDKKEFLADVSAFANAIGGVIVYGVETRREGTSDTGIPERIVGLGGANLDTEERRLTQLLHDGLEPSLASQVTFKRVDMVDTDGPVLLLGVRQSLLGPHKVSFQRNGRFWRRYETRKDQPGTSELRRMFLEPRSWIGEANEFRRTRIASVLAGEVLSPLRKEYAYFVHLLPLGRLDLMIDPVALMDRLDGLGPFDHQSGWSPRPNADGLFVYNTIGQEIYSYTQWFRFGGVEGFTSGIGEVRNTNKIIWGDGLTEATRIFVQGAIERMRDVLALEPPIAIGLTLLGVIEGYLLRTYPSLQSRTFDRNRIDVPFVILEDVNADPKPVLQHALDVIWQAGGYGGAP